MTDAPVSFPPEVENELIGTFGMHPEGVARLLTDYQAHLDQILRDLGAPEITALTVSDAYGLFNIRAIDSQNGESWADFKVRVQVDEQDRLDAQNPFLPNWFSKTEDRKTPWVTDTENGGSQVSEETQRALTRLFKSVTPFQPGIGLKEFVGKPPTSDTETVMEICQAMEHASTLLIRSLGESSTTTPEFKWGPALAMVAGLGFDALRFFANKLGQTDEDWDYWATCPTTELFNDVMNARILSSYPMALLRADYCQLQAICMQHDLAPTWIKASLLCHIMRHVRYDSMYKTKDGIGKAFHVMYDGERVIIPIDDRGLEMTLQDQVNQVTARALCARLGVRFELNPRNRTTLDNVIYTVLAKIHPRDLPALRDFTGVPELIIPQHVEFSTSHDLRSDYKWINTGIQVGNAARIDVDSGVVDKKTILAGPAALLYRWPRVDLEPEEMMTWRSNIPAKVTAMKPSDFVRNVIRNINTLGEPDGFWNYLDAVILGDLMRKQLAGSDIGNAIRKEFPLVMIMPMGHDIEDTTNQGKTGLARILAPALAPGVVETTMNRSTSPPSLRTMSMNLEMYGTDIYDEYLLPGNDHFLGKQGIQSLATGGSVSVGRANANAQPIRAKHPLFFTCKMPDFNPDINNRLFPIYMDVLTDETKLSVNQLSLIMSGISSNILRLSALMWIKKNDLVERVRKAPLAQAAGMRYNGHLAIASVLTDGNIECVTKYLAAAEAQRAAQVLGAQNSGLSDDIGGSPKFEAAWFFRQATEFTMKSLADQTRTDIVTPTEFMRQVIENGNRDVDRVLQQHRITERAALTAFNKAMRTGTLVRPGWRAEITEKRGQGANRHARQCVILINTDAEERAAQAKPTERPA